MSVSFIWIFAGCSITLTLDNKRLFRILDTVNPLAELNTNSELELDDILSGIMIKTISGLKFKPELLVHTNMNIFICHFI